MNRLYPLLAIKILQCLTCLLLNFPSASTDRLMVLFHTFIKGAFLFKIADCIIKIHHGNLLYECVVRVATEEPEVQSLPFSSFQDIWQIRLQTAVGWG